MKIPIIMCHGVSEKLDVNRFNEYFNIASEMGFTSTNYHDLEAWLMNGISPLEKTMVFDFDHPVRSIYEKIFPLMKRYGLSGSVFINTEPLEQMYENGSFKSDRRVYMTWDEIGELLDNGWRIGAHTHSHPNLSDLAAKDPSGDLIRQELEKNDSILEKELSIKPRHFAFTGTSWSSLAEQEVKKRYQLGRLWIISANYQADGKWVRYADLVGNVDCDEIDGGPPYSARYITQHTAPYRIPSMELEGLIYDYGNFRAYLEGACC